VANSATFFLPEHVLDEETSNALWYWLDQQSEVKQWEIIEQFAKVRPLNLVLCVGRIRCPMA